MPSTGFGNYAASKRSAGSDCAAGVAISDLRVGDCVDFWPSAARVGRLLLLAAEMKIPGRLWLQFEVDQRTQAVIRRTTVFDPFGYVGLAYWYLLYPSTAASLAACCGINAVGRCAPAPAPAGRIPRADARAESERSVGKVLRSYGVYLLQMVDYPSGLRPAICTRTPNYTT
jgi:hypothetical protein